MVTDDEEELGDHDTTSTQPIPSEGSDMKERADPVQIGFDEAQKDILDEHPTFLDDVQEYMHLHYRLNYASHVVMMKITNKKMLPKGITQILKKMEKKDLNHPCVMTAIVHLQPEHHGGLSQRKVIIRS